MKVEEIESYLLHHFVKTPCCQRIWDGDGNGKWCPKCERSVYDMLADRKLIRKRKP